MRLEHRIPPPVVGLVTALAMGLSTWAWAGSSAWPVVRIGLALLLAAVGGAFSLAGLLAFRRARTTVNPLRPERASALVTDGVYRLTRNPMYVGMLLVLLGWAVFLSAPLAWPGPLLFAAYIQRFQIRPEERALTALFGSEYEAFCRSVRRWL